MHSHGLVHHNYFQRSGGFNGHLDGRFGGRCGFVGPGGRGGRGQWRERIDRQASVSVRSDWCRVEEINLSKLSKGMSPHSAIMDTSDPKGVKDLLWCGFLDQYNDQYDKVSTRNPAPLKRVEMKEFYPVIERFAIEGKGTIFATDAILAHLMTCPRWIYPWDIVVQKFPTDVLFFDNHNASQFDYLTVHESNEEKLVNSPERLSLKATMINQNYTQQILRSAKHRHIKNCWRARLLNVSCDDISQCRQKAAAAGSGRMVSRGWSGVRLDGCRLEFNDERAR
ncbi:hypothetical protein ACHAWF_005989 [Thalassiosira exigua]